MHIIHNHSADQKDNGSSSGDDKRVGEKLRPGVVLDVIPRPMKRGEDVDKKKRIQKYKYQKEEDIVFRDVIIWYFSLQHFSKKSPQR